MKENTIFILQVVTAIEMVMWAIIFSWIGIMSYRLFNLWRQNRELDKILNDPEKYEAYKKQVLEHFKNTGKLR